tara:strand:+ start:2157 stop:2318 length:162 start_codon:yes stop_codon:yes gene_type:complete
MNEITFYPLFGLVFGGNYYNSEMDDVDEGAFKKHTIEVFLFLFGINFIWYTEL